VHDVGRLLAGPEVADVEAHSDSCGLSTDL
jgi:hypothetical protein